MKYHLHLFFICATFFLSCVKDEPKVEVVEPTPVALAIREHYCPRFAGDTLPTTLEGCALSLADQLDTPVGIFGVNQAPTGDKDPFGLRRAAIGILRITIEKELSVLDKKNQALREQWMKEKEEIFGLKAVKAEIESVRLEVERAEREGNLEKAAELKYGRLPELEKKLAFLG